MHPKRPIFLILSLTILILSVFLHSQAWGTSIGDIQNPKESKQWVMDTAKIWSQETESQLEKTLSDLEVKNKTEFVIITVPDILAGTDLRPIAKTLRKKFYFGKPEFDNGLLLLISKRPGKLIGVVSKGNGIPTYYFYTDVIDGNKIQTIQQWLPLEIQGLSELSYQSQPKFRRVYQIAGWVGLGLAVAGFLGFEYLTRHFITRRYLAQQKLAGCSELPLNSNFVRTRHFVHASVFSIRLGKTIGAISLSTFLLSKSPILGGLNTGNSDFLWVILVDLGVLPIHIIPDLWLRSRTKLILSIQSRAYGDLLSLSPVLLLPSLSLLRLFQQGAYSNVYKSFSHIGTSPILEFIIILFGLLISVCIFPLFRYSAKSKVT